MWEGRGLSTLQHKGAGHEGGLQDGPGNLEEKFSGVLCLSILYPDIPIAGECQPVQVDSALCIHVRLPGLSF